MSDVTTVRKALGFMGEYSPSSEEEERSAYAAMDRVEQALRHLTAEHGTQCRCPGCEVLREGA